MNFCGRVLNRLTKNIWSSRVLSKKRVLVLMEYGLLLVRMTRLRTVLASRAKDDKEFVHLEVVRALLHLDLLDKSCIHVLKGKETYGV